MIIELDESFKKDFKNLIFNINIMRKFFWILIIVLAIYSWYIVHGIMRAFWSAKSWESLSFYEDPFMIFFLLFIVFWFSMLFSDKKENNNIKK